MCQFLCSAKAMADINTHSSISRPKIFILDIDISQDSIGAALSQIYEGAERVVAYASHSMTKAERKYCGKRKELLAVVTSTKLF